MKVLNLIVIITALFCYIGCSEDGNHLWPGGVIPFVTIGFDKEENKEILKCATEWSAAGIKIVPADKIDNHILYIVKADGIEHTAGLSLGFGYNYQMPNIISISKFDEKYLLHELGHKIGLPHEHQRPDRDLYIKLEKLYEMPAILEMQMIPQEPTILKNYSSYIYDCKSIMHYTKDEFEIAGYDADLQCGDSTNDKITAIDLMKVSDMYKDEVKP